MNGIRHGTHWGSAQCSRSRDGVCLVCREFLTTYQRSRRAAVREAYLRELCEHLTAERQERQDGAT